MTPRPSLTDDDVERVARAICNGWGENFGSIHRDKKHWTETHGAGPGGRFRDVNEPRQDDFREMARAAIAAMPAFPQIDALIKAAQRVEDMATGKWTAIEGCLLCEEKGCTKQCAYSRTRQLSYALAPFTRQPEGE